MSEIACLIFLVAGASVDPPQREQSAEAPNEIVVTGERVPRRLRDTTSSVEAFTGDMIERTPGADRLDQLLELVPNVQVGSGGHGPTIRGQDTTGVLQDLPAFLGGTRPRVTLQVDGRAVGFNEFVFGVAPLWDVEQVEVFRSPQTTTQGRNSIAGAIFVNTRDPTYEWEGSARAIAGDLDTRQLSALVNGPLIAEQVAFRIAGDLRRARTASHITDRMPGADPNKDRFGMLRFKLLAEPMSIPGLRLEASYVHTESRMPQTERVQLPFRERRDPSPGYGVFKSRIDSLTMQAKAELGRDTDLTTTLAFGDSLIRRFPPPGLGRTNNAIRDWSVESILSWKPDGPVQLLGGVHYLRTWLDQTIDLTAVLGFGEFDDRQRSLGLFGQARIRPAPRLTLTAGARYQHDRQHRVGQIGNSRFLLPLDYNEGFDAFLPKLSLAYELNDQATAGVMVQRAYNPGGTSLNFDTGEAEVFGPETLWSFEAFARARIAGGRLRLSGNLFYNRFRDAQRAQSRAYRVPGGATAFWAEIENLPRAESYGLEASAEWIATPRLELRGGLGVLKTRIIEATPATALLRGKDFGRAPAWTVSASVDWRPVGALRFNASFRHNSSYFSDDANTPSRRVGPATRIDARIAYELGRFTLFGHARNLLDEFDMTYLFSPTAGTASDPREVGVGIEMRF